MAVSCDSFNEEKNRQIGRHQSGKGNLKCLRNVRDWCRKYHVAFKINTVVNVYNVDEDMNDNIQELAPVRWKVSNIFREIVTDYDIGNNFGNEYHTITLTMIITATITMTITMIIATITMTVTLTIIITTITMRITITITMTITTTITMSITTTVTIMILRRVMITTTVSIMSNLSSNERWLITRNYREPWKSH